VSAWEDLVTTALLGTERRMLPAALPQAVGRLAVAQADPGLAVLDAAAGYTSYRQAGARPVPRAALLPAPRQVTDLAPEPAQLLLGRLLGAREVALVNDWLTVCAARHLGVRAGLWVPLVTSAAARAGPDRALVQAALGQRGRAFLQLNPDWRSVARPPDVGARAAGPAWSQSTTDLALAAVRVSRSLVGRRVRVEVPAGGPGLRELLASSDLDAWQAHTGLVPETLLGLLHSAVPDRVHDLTAGLASAALAQRHPEWATALARSGHVTTELAALVPADVALELLGSGRLDAAAGRRLALAVAHHAPVSVLGDLLRLARSRQARPPEGPARPPDDGLVEAVRVVSVRVEIRRAFSPPTTSQETQ
jgi:hypothetical protein